MKDTTGQEQPGEGAKKEAEPAMNTKLGEPQELNHGDKES